MEHTGANPYTRGVADFVSGLRYEAIPAEVLARIKLLILDSFGCALYGTDLPWSQILIETLSGLDSSTIPPSRPEAPASAMPCGWRST